MPRVAIVIADSLGVGEMLDAAAWGDGGADTLGNIAESGPLAIPNLVRLGLGSIRPLQGIIPREVIGSYGKMGTAGAGKDTIAGHWEIAGCRVDRGFTVYYDAFPPALLGEFSAATGEGWLGNEVASGTEIIARLGAEHCRSRRPIVYTSADSVFQIAAHESVISVARLHEICELAFPAVRAAGIARVIARPFVGTDGAFVRTENRRDFALEPPRPTLMDRLMERGIPTTSIGKIKSIYGDRGFSSAIKAGNNATITQATIDALKMQVSGLIFSNLVDFDMLYGHRRDVFGYARALEALDARVPEIIAALHDDDLLLITADHGNDPTYPGTDHTREYVPILAYRHNGRVVDLGQRSTLADCGASAAEWLGVAIDEGTSFARDI